MTKKIQMTLPMPSFDDMNAAFINNDIDLRSGHMRKDTSILTFYKHDPKRPDEDAYVPFAEMLALRQGSEYRVTIFKKKLRKNWFESLIDAIECIIEHSTDVG
jgi:hypothetical protein